MSEALIDALRAELEDLVKQYEHRSPDLDQETKELSRGKLYELYVLGRTLIELRARGFQIQLSGAVLDLKQSPGMIYPHDTCFIATAPKTGRRFRICTDIEVTTLGAEITGTAGLCSYHEVDIVVVDERARGRPSFRSLALGVECKSQAKFKKNIVKEVLGVKREISLLTSRRRPSYLAQAMGKRHPRVPSKPPLEYWLCYLDPAGSQYSKSPSAFGIEFKCWGPNVP